MYYLNTSWQAEAALTPHFYMAVTERHLFAFRISSLYYLSFLHSCTHPTQRSSVILMCMWHDLFIQVSPQRMSCYSPPPSVNAISPQYGCGDLSLFKSPFAFSATAAWVILSSSLPTAAFSILSTSSVMFRA